MGYFRVFLADVAPTAAATATPLQRRAASLRRVHIQGLCVWRESVGAQLLRLEVDDGTGVAMVQVRGDAALAELQEVAPGKMVKALGDVQETPLFASGRSWKRWIEAGSVCIVEDPNAESLHVLETLLVQKAVYAKQPAIPHNEPLDPSSIPLLAFPDQSESSAPNVGVKRKLAVASDPAPRPPHAQPVLTEMSAPRGVLNPPTSTIPPAEYQFHVASADLKLIASGTKTLEIRLNNPPYSIIRVHDRIKFNSKLVTTVRAVRKYAQLRSALELEPLSALLPHAGGASVHQAIRHLRQYISEAEETNHGVAVFELQAPAGASSGPRTPEEWSILIYEHVGKAGATGCSLRDLQFAFPSLPVDKLEAMLTDLQIDAVVYLSKGAYRLV